LEHGRDWKNVTGGEGETERRRRERAEERENILRKKTEFK
jgi:hypothetical protein